MFLTNLKDSVHVGDFSSGYEGFDDVGYLRWVDHMRRLYPMYAGGQVV